MDATYHATQYLIYALQNTAPASPLVKLGHGNKEALNNLANIFRKITPPSSTSDGASQGGRSKETPINEPRRK